MTEKQIEKQIEKLSPVDELVNNITKMRERFEPVLARDVSFDRFTSVVISAIRKNMKLLSSKESLYKAIKDSAESGLLPDGKQAAFIMYGSQVTFMPMIAGIIKKIYDTGIIKLLTLGVVNSDDEFDYWVDEDGPHLKHRPKFSGEFKYVYAVAKTTAGDSYIEVITKEEIDKVKKNTGPWKQWPDEMRKKTVIKRLAKRLPVDVDFIIALDNQQYDISEQPVGENRPQGNKLDGNRLLGIMSNSEWLEDNDKVCE